MNRAILLLGVVLLLSAGATRPQSLFQEEHWRGLTADNKAFRSGDVLTVQVYENSSATTSADTGTHRNNRLSAALAHGSNRVHQASLNIGGDFDGGGRTQRASRLLATLTVSVQEILPGGQLRIAGTQDVTVNEELQRVTLEGVVRPVDITDGNIVQSTRIANARITYVGEGDVSERNRRSWWRKFLDAVGF
jgi:flagellar L-ring protein FlgH